MGGEHGSSQMGSTNGRSAAFGPRPPGWDRVAYAERSTNVSRGARRPRPKGKSLNYEPARLSCHLRNDHGWQPEIACVSAEMAARPHEHAAA